MRITISNRHGCYILRNCAVQSVLQSAVKKDICRGDECFQVNGPLTIPYNSNLPTGATSVGHCWSIFSIFLFPPLLSAYVISGRPLGRLPCAGCHNSSCSIISSLFLQQCLANLSLLSLTKMDTFGRFSYRTLLVVCDCHLTF